ncbi:hypothetical protein ACIBHX_45255 [Nonomuraea sp. NPDC050536]|uniref:hypothetical protein n=1 Tax=Nonomuraea sp. NPDC050536 TaxID=3364366 RepID=UPI0037CA6126
MFSVRFRFPGAGVVILIIVIMFTVTLLRLGYEPEAVLALIAGTVAVAVKATQQLLPRSKTT